MVSVSAGLSAMNRVRLDCILLLLNLALILFLCFLGVILAPWIYW
jgi:hypothetical protein